MINKLKNILHKLTLTTDLIGALVINCCYILVKRNKKNRNNFILAYAPFKDKPWILNKIFFDLKSSSEKSENYKIFNSLLSLSIFRLKNGGNILSMHQSNIKKLFFAGFKLADVSTYYTHTRINQKGIEHINKLKYIFCQNNYEYALLKSSYIHQEKIINLPVGLHSNFLIHSESPKNIKDREFDVLFCLRYQIDNNHYSTRKRYNFIIELSNLLSKANFKVCIMGEGWDQIKNHIYKKVVIINPPFKDYGLIYKDTKIYCNPSFVEGGPISLAEAFSSGCIICTTPVGLSFNLCIEDHLSFLMPFDEGVDFWYEKLVKLIKNNDIFSNYEDFINSRESKINKITFKNLSSKLEQIILDIN